MTSVTAMNFFQHIIGDRTPDPFVPFYAERDPTVNSDPLLPFFKSLDENVRIHRERADALKAAYDKQIVSGDPICHRTWETYAAQCDCLADAIERRHEAWEHRQRTKTAKRWSRIRASILLGVLGIVVSLWFCGSRSLVFWSAIAVSLWIIGAAVSLFAHRFLGSFSDAVAEKVIERRRREVHGSSS